MILEPGQIWKEADNRVTRIVEILSIDGSTALIRTVGKSRITRANVERFNNRAGGYSFVVDPPVPVKLKGPSEIPIKGEPTGND